MQKSETIMVERVVLLGTSVFGGAPPKRQRRSRMPEKPSCTPFDILPKIDRLVREAAIRRAAEILAAHRNDEHDDAA